MDLLRTLPSRIASLFRRNHLDSALDEELRSHIDLATAENMTLGMNRKQARIAALRSFGGLTQAREAYRQRRGFPILGQLAQDVRFGLRQLHRAPGFAATAILTLAAGLGATIAIFSLMNALLLRPLPVPRSEQLVVIQSQTSEDEQPGQRFSAPMFRALEKRHPALQDVAAFFDTQFQVRSGSGSVEKQGAMVSGEFFRAMQTAPLFGRYLTPQDDRPGSAGGYPVVLSEGFWRTWFNSAPNVLGSRVTIANVPFTVVGVMPRSFIGADPTRRPELYLPLSAEPIVDAPFDMTASGENAIWLNMIARRQNAVSLEQANAALSTVSVAVLEEAVHNPDRLKSLQKTNFLLTAESGSQGETYMRSQFRKPLLVVFSLCIGVLLLACLNLASLLMARASARERELATRLAIGASRGRLLQQLLAESLLIATLGTLAGVLLAPIVSRSLAAMLLGSQRNVYLDTSLDWRASAFAASLTLLTGLLIGLVPALRATSGDLNQQIKNGSQSRPFREKHRLLPRALMGLQVALALMLVIGAGLLAASLTRLYRTGLGFDPNHVVTLSLDMNKQGLEGDALIHWYEQFAGALAHQPGVRELSFNMVPPFSGIVLINSLHTAANKLAFQNVDTNEVGPSYFQTMHIPILNGRDFRWSDTATSGNKVVLSASAARLLFPNQDPIGKSVLAFQDKAYEVIAVVGDTKYESIQAPAPPEAYFPITQSTQKKPSYNAVVRLDGPAAPFASTVHALTARMAPDIPAPVFNTMSGILDDSISSARMMALLSVFFAACALLVTAIGLYGTLAYATARRTGEIGIRMALGAQRLQVVALVFRENAWVSISGCAAGLIAALLASKALASFLYGTSTRDPWVLTGAVLALIAIASAASLIPAIRAAKIEPIEALRTE